MDRFENNDTAATATDLRTISGTTTESSLSIEAGDPDWYRFTLGAAGRSGDKATITFTHAQGDLDLALYASNGTTVLDLSEGTGNSEEITLAGLAAGTYYLRVYGYDNAANPAYALSVAAAPATVSGDRFENNDTAATATDLRTISGTTTESSLSIEAGDPDWYRFTLGTAGRSGDKAAITFSHAAGDLDLVLYASNGTTELVRSEGTGNSEEVSLAGLSAGTYYLRVFGYDNAANPSYALSVAATPATVSGDRFENNDTAATATDLRTISGTTAESSLSIEAGDPDWYRFTLGAAGRSGDKATITFTHAQGDLDLALYASNGTTLLSQSNGVANSEEVSLAGLSAGTYYLRVYGYDNAANPSYALSVAATPAAVSGDRFENNDTAATATDLRTISGTTTETGLSIEAGDPDWYRFTLAAAGRSGDKATITFTHALGDLDLAVYGSDGTTRLWISEGTGNSEEIGLAGMPAGTYYVRVYGYAGAANPSYSLSLSAAPATVVGDRYENNDTPATATDLRTISGTTTESSLSIEAGDPDWYRFTLGSAGRAGDRLAIGFTHAQGDLDLELYASDGTTLVDYSEDTDNTEEISLAGLPAGNYYARVYGYAGAANPSYTLSVSAAPLTVSGDRFENNDTAATATDLRTISGTVVQPSLSIEAGDPDWYRFTLASAGRSGDQASIAFTHATGDLDLALYASNGTTLITQSDGTGNTEEISFNGLAAGTYLLRVYGYDNAANPSYGLTIAAAPVTVSGDRFENNDTAATATDLRTISGTTTESGLSIEAGDPDWFRFTLSAAGRTGDKASITFNHGQGDLDLALYAGNGTTRLAVSEGTGNAEEISLAGLSAGTYQLRVYGYDNASNPSYTLSVATTSTTGLTADAWESNNTSAQATPIRQAESTFSRATITTGDQDWYAFSLPATGGLADSVRVVGSSGDVDLRVLDARGAVVAATASDAGGQASVSLTNLPAGSYYAQVSGHTATAQSQYDLSVRAVGASGAPPTTSGSWTILVYICGDNDLEAAAIDDINEMEAALLRAGVSVAVQIDRSIEHDTSNGNWSDTRRGVITRDGNTNAISSQLASIGEVDMGRQQSLTEFINWGAGNLPAQNYAVVVWDHGSGTIGGSAFDDSPSGSYLTNAEVRQAVAASSLQRVALLGFDACLMAMAEVMSEAAPVADRLVASVMTEPGDGWDYTAFLTRFAASSSSDASSLASIIVDTYGTFYRDQQTLSSVDLGQASQVEGAINAFATAMRGASTADWQAVRTARTRATEADQDFTYYVDLTSFMTQLQQASGNAAIDSAAAAVVAAVDRAVLRDVGPGGFDGLSIVFPTSQSQANSIGYLTMGSRFLANTAWDDFLQSYYTNVRAGPATAVVEGASAGTRALGVVVADYAERMDLAGVPRGFRNDTVATSYDLGTINQTAYRVPGLTIDAAADADWFRFSTTAGSGTTSLSVRVADPTAPVTARLLDGQQAVVATATTAAGTGTLNLTLATGAAQFLEVTNGGNGRTTSYELTLNGLGSAVTTPTADFAEASGGNNSRNKAYLLGEAGGLMELGTVRNLSYTTADAQSGADGGDWFLVDSARTASSNARRVAIVDASGGDLDLRVYDLTGRLLAESATAGTSAEAVVFTQQVSDLLVQVVSRGGQTTQSYGLAVSSAAVPLVEGSAFDDALADFWGGASRMRGGAGQDNLDGRSGIDTALYEGRKADSTITRTASGWTVASTAEGRDALTGIERLAFSDVSVALDLSGNAGVVAKTLGAVFGKASVANRDYAGIGLSYSDGGMSYPSLMQLAIDARLGAGASHAAVVNLLFGNVVGRAPNADESAFYVGMLDRREISVSALGVLAADTTLNAANIQLTGLEQQGLEYVPFGT